MSHLSRYTLSLDPPERRRYKEKLTVSIDNNDVALPDPYGLSENWVIDPKKLPPTGYGAIWNYLIKTPGPFTGEAMEAYKSLDAYNYYKSGLISEMKVNDVGGNYGVIFVKALVEPGQKQNCAPFNPWICLKSKSGYVIASHCTCMAGLGEVCSHVAAVLFFINDITEEQETSQPAPTSVKCAWSSYQKTNVMSTTADKLDFSHPRHRASSNKKKAKTSSRRKRIECPELTPDEQKAALTELALIQPHAAVLTKGPSDTDTASEGEEEGKQFPPLPYRLARVKGPSTVSATDIIDDATPTAQQIINLAAATQQQANSALWMAHRKGRITASNSHRVLHCREPSSVLDSIMKYQSQDISYVPAIKWGVDNEPNAKQEYISAMKNAHDHFEFENSGLVVSMHSPFVAASPDGLAKCDCHGTRLVEFKCPYKQSKMSPSDIKALSESQYCLDMNGRLKKTHKYYCQIQTQMYVTGAFACDFVVWTTVGLHVDRVERDEEYIENLTSKMDNFVMEYLIPELISRKLDYLNEINASDKSSVFCLCKRPAFGKMITCGNDDCMIEQFHYECVNLKRKPQKKWFCGECST